MNNPILKHYIRRAGIRSVRELSELTGIPERTLDRIIAYPRRARGFQIESIREACGMDWEEVGTILKT